jgi:O-methyltransferase involved in polyketide biosynthesis
MSSTGRISPTAHYTGYVWARNGLSHPELETVEGRVLFEALRPTMAVTGAIGSGTLEAYLLARHLAIDELLHRAIDRHGVSQVLEVACGLSPRGWRFSQRYGERITYLEADLPAMAARKRAALKRMGALSERHRVVDVDVLADEGVAAATATLEPDRGLVIITEGLLVYLPTDAVLDIWRRFGSTLSDFRAGRYLSDLRLNVDETAATRAFRVGLAAFVRGGVYRHFDEEADAIAALHEAGFASAELHRATDVVPERRASGAGTAHIIEASTI